MTQPEKNNAPAPEPPTNLESTGKPKTEEPSRSRLKSLLANILCLLLVALIIGAMIIGSRINKQRELKACIRNMQIIEQAKLQYQQKNGLPNGHSVMRGNIDDFINGGWHLSCPAIKKDNYLLGKLGQPPTCIAHGSLTNPHLAEVRGKTPDVRQ